ncbi:hypothetical protein HYZ41_02130 [archaeon]|nr:hypothetical protein [archaeon]
MSKRESFDEYVNKRRKECAAAGYHLKILETPNYSSPPGMYRLCTHCCTNLGERSLTDKEWDEINKFSQSYRNDVFGYASS